jgi:hypothetical protein
MREEERKDSVYVGGKVGGRGQSTKVLLP